jgi:hypothetical protein
VQQRLGLDFKGALEWLAGRAGIRLNGHPPMRRIIETYLAVSGTVPVSPSQSFWVGFVVLSGRGAFPVSPAQSGSVRDSLTTFLTTPRCTSARREPSAGLCGFRGRQRWPAAASSSRRCH